MRKFKMFALAFLLVLFIPFAVDTSFANGFGGGDRGGGWSGSGFHTGTQNTVLSYDVLCDLCILVNEDIVMGVYDDVYPFSASSSITLAATVRYDSSSGYFVISCLYGGDYFNFRNASGGLFCSEVNPYSILSVISSRLSSVATKLDTIIDPYLNDIRRYVNNIGTALPTYVEQITTNAVANTTTMVEQLTTNADMNTTLVVDKLEEVITSADENFTTAIESINSNGGRLDTLIEEVRKISTYDARQEVEVVIPGVFGDIHSWMFPDDWRLSKGRDQIIISYNGSAERDVSYDSYPTVVSTAEVLDAQTSAGFYEWYICDYMGGVYEVARATIHSEAMSFTGGYLFVEAYGYDGNCIKSLTSYGSNSSIVMDLSEVASLRIYTNEDFVFFDSFGPNFSLVEVEFGNYVDVGCQELTFAIDGEWHTIDLARERFTVLPGSSIQWTLARNDWTFLDADHNEWFGLDCADQLTDAFTPPDTTEIQLMGNIFTWFEWFYNNQSAGEPGGLLDVTPIVNKLKDIENALANMGSNIDIENNTNINISEENENYNIFYVDDPDGGEDKSIVDLSGDTLKVFGKLLDFLYKVSFKGSLDNAGSSIGDLSDFYLDTSEGSADLWVS